MRQQIYKELRKRQKELEDAIIKLEKRISNYPEGTLNYRMCNGSPQYYHNLGSRLDENGIRIRDRKYITKRNMNLAITMAQKDYDISELAAVKRELEGINYLLECEEEGTPESIYDNLPYARKKLVTPFIKSFDYREAQWMNQDYEPLTGYELTTEYYTQRGERVRSKSEILIANQLNKYEIAYKYECPLQIDYGKTIYPDFTCMSKKTGTIMYWEHLGMMDNPEYCEYNLGKITQYENVGIFPGINLILTHETSLHPISTRIIDKIIAAYLY